MPAGQFANPLPMIQAGAGLATEFGTWASPGAQVLYVCNASRAYDNPEIQKRIVGGGGSGSTLARAIAQCRPGYGDIIYVLPGHVESVADATILSALVAGTRIIGVGDPTRDDAPTFNWTAAASAWNVAVKNVELRNLRLNLDGFNGVTKAINVTASGFRLLGNNIRLASGAALKATIGVEIGSGATECEIAYNYIRGTETHNVTDGIKVVGATVPSDLYIHDNDIIASATAANGLIHVTVAAKRIRMIRNRVYNTHTASTAAIAVDNVAADGIIEACNTATVNNGVATAQGITLGASALFRIFESYSSDEPLRSGVLNFAAPAT